MLNGQKFPHCGMTCRDKAKIAGEDPLRCQSDVAILRLAIDLASANAATCKTCIICWQADSGDQSDFCSDQCAEVAGKKAPFLLEVPRGHVAFKKGTTFSFSKDPYLRTFTSLRYLHCKVEKSSSTMSRNQESVHDRDEARL